MILLPIKGRLEKDFGTIENNCVRNRIKKLRAAWDTSAGLYETFDVEFHGEIAAQAVGGLSKGDLVVVFAREAPDAEGKLRYVVERFSKLGLI